MSSYTDPTWSFPPVPPDASFLQGSQQDFSFPVPDFSAFSVFNTPTPSQYRHPFSPCIPSNAADFPASPFESLHVTTAQLNAGSEYRSETRDGPYWCSIY
ncbi:hypothetical protein B0H17DRAFT_1190449 [Mycena rosella]|uniref:Uncharacterized protein n=1 Tax=Mycena rosella TaxID=1033263 RepID=A0AAD7H351_MYCRO|nr:hypothetical protein B0H17DRAFT_1190449 [Mycena rosella]